jgi:hypothetical protein
MDGEERLKGAWPRMSGMAQIAVSLETWKAIEAARLSLGESHDEIVRRLATMSRSRKGSVLRGISRGAASVTRRRGDVRLAAFGSEEAVANLKLAYVAALTRLVRHKPALFELLSLEGGTKRRWIARDAQSLFPGSPHLARDHAYALGSWWLDTNLSRGQIEARLDAACRIAGYRYGEDVRIVG